VTDPEPASVGSRRARSCHRVVGISSGRRGAELNRWAHPRHESGATRTRRLAFLCGLILPAFVLCQVAAGSCDLGRVVAGVDIAVSPETGDVIVVAQGLRVFRSTDRGSSYLQYSIGIEGSWPSVAFRGPDLFVAAGRWGEPNEIFLLHSIDGGASFSEPRVVFSSAANLVIDPELLVMRDGTLMVFASEMMSGNSDLVAFFIHVFWSTDNGWTWLQLPDAVVGPPFPPAIEDAKAFELPSGELLLAYEREMVDLGESRLEQIRSRDGGLTWEQPTVIWEDVPGSDNEPGGYLDVGPDGLWFLASTDEDSLETYADAVVKRKVSIDGGASWDDKATLVDELDQIVYGGAVTPEGMVVLATVRQFSTPPRFLDVYHIDPHVTGIWACAPPIFVDGFEEGGVARWSAIVP